MHIGTYQALSSAGEQAGSLCWRVDVYLQSIHHNLALSLLSDMLHSHFSTPSNVLRRRLSERWQQLWIATFFFLRPPHPQQVCRQQQPSNSQRFQKMVERSFPPLIIFLNVNAVVLQVLLSRCLHPPSATGLTKNDSRVMLPSPPHCGFVPVQSLCPTGG